MTVVVDSSVAAGWCLPDEDTGIAEATLVLVEAGGMLVPPLFWYELRNVLVVSERRRRIDTATSTAGLKRIAALPTRIDGQHDEMQLLSLARRHALTVYDTAYLELAWRAEAPLATLDQALRRAAAAEGIRLVA